MSTPSSSFIEHPTTPSDDEIDSLPSSASSTISDVSSASSYSDAEREWEASLQQLEMLLTMMIVPFIGKYLGRKMAYWGWGRYMEWMYPVNVRITNKTAFNVAGAVEVAATL